MDAYDSLTELNFILGIFTLHYIQRPNELALAKWPSLKMSFILFCVGLMLSYNIYCHYFVEFLFDVNKTVKVTDTISVIGGYLQYLTDLYFVYKYGGEPLLSYYEAYDEIDKHFHMKYHREIRRKVRYSMAIFLVLWLLSSAADYAVWCMLFNFQSPTTYVVVYFTFLMRILTVLELNAHSMLIGYRLKTVVDVLRDEFSSAEDMPTRIKVVKKWPRVLIKSKAKIVPVEIRNTREVARLGSYYLLLNQQATFLNNFFGVRILMHCLYTLSETISFVNLMDRVLLGSMHSRHNIGYCPAVTTFLRLFTVAALLASLVYRCEQSGRQTGHVIAVLDHLLVDKKTSPEVYTSLQQLRAVVVTRPIQPRSTQPTSSTWTLRCFYLLLLLLLLMPFYLCKLRKLEEIP